MENSTDSNQPRCAACGRPLKEDEAICPHCDAGLAPKPELPPSDPSWGADIFATFVALVATLVASVPLNLRLNGMLFFWLLMMVLLLGRRWRQLNAKQIAFRSLGLLFAAAAISTVVLSVLWAGCVYLMRGIH